MVDAPRPSQVPDSPSNAPTAPTRAPQTDAATRAANARVDISSTTSEGTGYNTPSRKGQIAIAKPGSAVVVEGHSQVFAGHPSLLPKNEVIKDTLDILEGSMPDTTEPTEPISDTGTVKREYAPDPEDPIFRETKDARAKADQPTGEKAPLPTHVVTDGKPDMIGGPFERPTGDEKLDYNRPLTQDQDPALRARPWDKVPDRVVQEKLDKLRPHEEIDVTLSGDALEAARHAHTRAAQQELVVYGMKPGDNGKPESWYVGRKDMTADTGTSSDPSEGDVKGSPKVTIHRTPLNVTTAFLKEIEDQTGKKGRLASAFAGDEKHLEIQTSQTPPFGTDFDSEHEFANRESVADLIRTDGKEPMVGEIKSTDRGSALDGLTHAERHALNAERETGKPHRAFLELYGRAAKAGNPDPEDPTKKP